jgi:predicted transposase YdaD
MAGHDESYKRLFSHPEMVRDLIQGFVREGWVNDLDFGTLERVSGSYVTDDLRNREEDVVWRVRLRGRWLYVYLLIEFQSTIDRWMALRMLVYVGLFYQDLIRRGDFGLERGLPPVLPIVLYNGERRWQAAVEVSDLIEPPPAGLAAYAPQMRYLLLDEGAYADAELAPLGNLAAALFRLEHSSSPETVRAVVECLIGWLRDDGQRELRRSFTLWLNRVFLARRLPGVDIPEMAELEEVRNMLAEKVQEWTEQWKQQGLQEGREQGLEEGLKEGLKEGLQKGIRDGEATLLLRQLEMKFGRLDARTIERVRAASSEVLLDWGGRLIDAQRLEDVLGEE